MKEKFEMLLDSKEEIKWCGNINVSAYVRKNLLKTFLFGLFPPFALLMLGVPYSWLILLLSILKVIPLPIGLLHFVFSLVVCLGYTIILRKNAENTFLCITNKRVIKRSGAFNNDFIHYSLKNIGNVQIDSGIFDKKEDNPSASLHITVKDYHTNTDGNSSRLVLSITSLNDVYTAYKIINHLIEGNNETLRVEIKN